MVQALGMEMSSDIAREQRQRWTRNRSKDR